MKNIILSFIVVATLLSCNTDLDQQSILTPSSETIESQEALFAAYGFLQAATNEEFYFGTLRSDIGFAQSFEAPYANFDSFNSRLVDASDLIILPYWFNLYRTIITANIVIDRNNSVDALTGEAQFLRAYSYFKLVQAFGPVPINTATSVSFDTNDAFERQPVTDVYQLIIDDLTAASNLLGDEMVNGRPSSFSAKALLGKVYMTNGDPSLAEPFLKDVIDNSGSVLESSYETLFTDGGESSSEVLFSVQYSATGDTYSNIFTFEITGSFSRIINPVTDLLKESYEEGDIRAALTFDNNGAVIKHFSDDMSTTSSEADWYSLRLADVILLYAEATLANGSLTDSEVLALLDDIRGRANLAPLVDADFANSEAVLQAIKDERKVELAWEGHRWFDLVRWGDAKTALGFDSDDYLLFPIPVSEVLATSGVIYQNSGY